MVINDPIADMLTRIRNAGHIGKKATLVPFSDMKLRLAGVLLEEGYITHVAKKTKKGKTTMRVLEIGIAYDTSSGMKPAPRVKGAVRVSRPSRRLYVGAKEIRPVNQGHGIMILSTPKGVMTASKARKEHVGGEIVCKVW